MPWLGQVPEVAQTQYTTNIFAGYNRALEIGEGNNSDNSAGTLEFYDMKNLTSKYYPLMANRPKRGNVKHLYAPGGMITKERLAYVDDGKLYYGGQEVEGLTLTQGEKQLVSMGAYLTIWPDRKYVNTANLQDFGDIDAETQNTGVTYSLCDRLDADIDAPTEEPEDPQGGDYWIDTTGDVHYLKQWNGVTGEWITVPTVYTKISKTGIGVPFKQYDGAKFSGIKYIPPEEPEEPGEGEEEEPTGENGTYTKVFSSIPVVSNWTVTSTGTAGLYKYGTPSTGVENITFDTSSIPAGSTIVSATFSYNTSFSRGGTPALTIYGSGKPATTANVLEYLNNMQGDYEDIKMVCRYKANPGSTGTSSASSGTCYFTAITLNIVYEAASPQPTPGGDDETLIKQYELLNGYHILHSVADDYVVIVGLIDKGYQQTEGTVTVERKAPDMDYITEAYNRLWGCKYGIVDGQNLNEIYCCKLGDFKNWHVYEGVSTDSFTASVGTDGPWTGAITHLGYPLFFKENYMHKVQVSSQGAHQIASVECRGVQDGCWRSLSIVGEALFYKARSGVMMYDGSLPQLASTALGEIKYSGAVAGNLDDKYYISMKDDGTGEWHLFVLDTAKGLWHREDGTHAMCFAKWANDLYYIDVDSGDLFTVNGSEGTVENEVRWSATTGLIGYTYVGRKYISRFNLRMALPEGSTADLYIEYDSDGTWHHSGHMRGYGTGSFNLPVRPRRCDHFRVRIEGHGEVRVYSMAKVFEAGSDVI